MSLPEPEPGLVISYRYLWRREADSLRIEGKARPCVIVLDVERAKDGSSIVTVVPVTRQWPGPGTIAVEMPALTKRGLGLDESRSWVIVDEVNRFVWPGVDLEPIPHGSGRRFAYGQVPSAFYQRILRAILSAWKAKGVKTVPR